MNLAQKLKKEQERYVVEVTKKTIGYYTTDLLDSEGNLIACQMRDDLLKMGYYEIH